MEARDKAFEELQGLCYKILHKFNDYFNKCSTKDFDYSEEWDKIINLTKDLERLIDVYKNEIKINIIMELRKFINVLFSIQWDELLILQHCAGNLEHLKYYNDLLKIINKIEISFETKEEEEIKDLQFKINKEIFEKDVTDILNLTYNEVLSDYKNSCYISSISLCGKIIETILYELAKSKLGIDPTKEKFGINALINRFKKRGYEFKGIKEQIDMINLHRNKAIHGNIIIPTKDEARGVISLTRDILQKSISKEKKIR